MKLIDVTGQRFGRLTAIGRGKNSRNRKSYWLCICDCGTEREVSGEHLRYGLIRSCGCLLRESRQSPERLEQFARVRHLGVETLRTHGMSYTSEYGIWCAMKARCGNPKTNRFAHYGGRGIQVCAKWKNSFEDFFADVGPRPSPDHSIDRINVDGNYKPGNVRWATPLEQARNKQPRRARAA